MENDIKKFLESIQELKEEKFDVNQITTGNKVKCKKISFKQQKNIISTITDGASGVMKFQKILNDIIMENTETNDWLVVDKIPVIVKMRIESLGNLLKNKDTEIDLNQLKLLEKFNTPTTTKIKGSVDVNLRIPTLSEENKVLNYAVDFLKNSKESDIGKDITNIFTFEIVKYIESVVFNGQVLNFSDMPIKDRILVVENLPISVNKSIVEYIETIKNEENEQLKLVVDGETKVIEIDVTFFDN